jgi:hypothetical protein
MWPLFKVAKSITFLTCSCCGATTLSTKGTQYNDTQYKRHSVQKALSIKGTQYKRHSVQKALSTKGTQYYDTQYYDTQYYDTQYYDTQYYGIQLNDTQHISKNCGTQWKTNIKLCFAL